MPTSLQAHWRVRSTCLSTSSRRYVSSDHKTLSYEYTIPSNEVALLFTVWGLLGIPARSTRLRSGGLLFDLVWRRCGAVGVHDCWLLVM